MHGLRNYVGAPLLLGYMALLVLAAWPTEIRPSILDDLNAKLERDLFHGAGITAGQPLFHADEDTDWVRRAFCVKVRGQHGDGNGETSELHPPDELCQVDGFRIRLPPVERALHRILVWAYDASTSGRSPGSASDHHLARIGGHFCTQPGPGGEAQREISLIWYWYHENYTNGQLRRYNALQYRFDCVTAALSDRAWMVGDRDFVAFWGSEPWE
jgi:hypothetical protein